VKRLLACLRLLWLPDRLQGWFIYGVGTGAGILCVAHQWWFSFWYAMLAGFGVGILFTMDGVLLLLTRAIRNSERKNT